MSETDKAFFRAHPETNYRLRKPGAGEVDDILARMHSGAALELAQLRELAAHAVPAGIAASSENGNLPCLLPGHSWMVLVLKLPSMHCVRMLTVDGWLMEDHSGVDPVVGAMAFMVGGRLAIEKMKGA